MTIELRCRKLKWATVPVQSWQMVIIPLPTLSSTAQCPFSRGSYILTTMVSIYALGAMVIQRQWSEWQWLEKLTTLNLWRLILFLVEVNEFEDAHQGLQWDRRGRCGGPWGTPSPCSPPAPWTPWCSTLASRTTPPSSFTTRPSPSPTSPSPEFSHNSKAMQFLAIKWSARKCFKLWRALDGYISSRKNWKPSWYSALWLCNISQQEYFLKIIGTSGLLWLAAIVLLTHVLWRESDPT